MKPTDIDYLTNMESKLKRELAAFKMGTYNSKQEAIQIMEKLILFLKQLPK